jgi:hypothetical protein
MGRRTTQVRNVRTAIRRLRALASEVDRAVKAAAQVRRELSQYPETALLYPVLSGGKRC